MITIKSIVYQPNDEPLDYDAIGFQRRTLVDANLIEGYGIEGDRKGGHPKRNLNVMDDVTQSELAEEGYPTGVGVLGENIILRGVNLRKLPEGTQLRLGKDAIITLGKLREPCERLTPLDERMPESVIGRVGVMCRIVKSGHIRVGDPVEIVPELVAK
ncbi:MAG: MOSC domain-containing protein [Anaerolineae bacterium]|nr:MOSC domain-containing protein [Anaerolineae bacterium]